MKQRGCERESEVVAAVRSGCWDDDLRRHAAACASCAESAFVAHHLLAEGRSLEAAPLPSPEVLWRRARLEESRRSFERATRAITVMQTVSAVVAAALTVVAGWWLLPELAASGATLLGKLGDAAAASGDAARPGAVILASFVILLTMALSEMWSAGTRG